MRRSSRSLTFTLCLLATWVPSAASAQREPQPAALAIEIGERAVVVQGSGPGERLLLLSLAQRTERFLTTLVREEHVVVGGSADGSAVLELEEPVPAQSVWFAVEVSTGRVAAAVPDGFELRELDTLSSAITSEGATVDLGLGLAELVLARPGVGTWGGRAGDGGASDLDQTADGTVRAGLTTLRPIADAPPPPDRLANGDVLVVVDPLELAFAVLRPEVRGGRS